MKKKFLFCICILLLIVVLSAALFACGNRKQEEEDKGIIIRFVTGFEDKGVTIDYVVSTHAVPATMPEDPFYPGWEFLGWCTDRDRTQPFDTKMGLKGDTTLYAKWTQRKADSGEDVQSPEVEAPSGVKYRLLSDDTYAVIGYNGSESVLALAPQYQGKTVTAIQTNAISSDAITRVIIPSTITNIEDGAFMNLRNVTAYEVNEASVSYASYDGILYNKERTAIVAANVRESAFTLAKAVNEIRPYAFSRRTYGVIFPQESALTVLDKYAFAYYAGEVEIGKNISEIRQRAFYGSTANVTFAAESGMTKLEMGEFDTFLGQKLDLPATIKSISGFAFAGCTAAIDMTKTGIKTLGKAAFAQYAGERFEVPYFVEEIEENGFYLCSANVTFDERSTYKTVKENAFIRFEGEVTFPYAVEKVEKNAFYYAQHATIRFARAQKDMTIEKDAFVGCDIAKQIVFGAA